MSRLLDQQKRVKGKQKSANMAEQPLTSRYSLMSWFRGSGNQGSENSSGLSP